MGAMPNIEVTHLRHDLMIEISRIEMVLEEIQERQAANQPQLKQSLQQRHAQLSQALGRLSA